ncbi:MAG: hypothetical protein MZV49_13595 [Rhodopseudomonas palustris]|nr:hypothetical protein [Rhodopseudomonas palustris]
MTAKPAAVTMGPRRGRPAWRMNPPRAASGQAEQRAEHQDIQQIKFPGQGLVIAGHTHLVELDENLAYLNDLETICQREVTGDSA